MSPIQRASESDDASIEQVGGYLGLNLDVTICNRLDGSRHLVVIHEYLGRALIQNFLGSYAN